MLWDISLLTNIFRQNQNPPNGLDAAAQNIDRIQYTEKNGLHL